MQKPKTTKVLMCCIFVLFLFSLLGCSSTNPDGFNEKYSKCSTYQISGDNVNYKNMQISVVNGFIYLQTPKLTTSQTLKVYAVRNNGSLSLVKFWVDDTHSDYTAFRMGEGFEKYAIKGDLGGVVYLSCQQEITN